MPHRHGGARRRQSERLRHSRKDSGDIPAAAKALGVPLTAHPVVMQRAGARCSGSAALAHAHASGLLAHFRTL